MLRHLKKQFVRSIGTPYQGTKHSAPDISKLVRKVQDKAEELASHIITPGRKVKFYAQDILADGAELLRSKGMNRFKRRYKKWVRESTMYSYQAYKSMPCANDDGEGSDAEGSGMVVDDGEGDNTL